MQKGFLVSERPTLTAMLRSTTLEELIAEIGRVKEEGTDAFGFQIDLLRVEDRSPEAYRAIFGAMGAPSYTTNYARPHFDRFDDEELTREEIEAQSLRPLSATICAAIAVFSQIVTLTCGYFLSNSEH